MEDLFKAPANDILDAIGLGFRTQVDVKGKLAELYLGKKLEEYKNQGVIDHYTRNDRDGEPDFAIYKNSKRKLVECKNLRSGPAGIYNSPRAYKVEVQKTRNSLEGQAQDTPCPSRLYPVGYFDILSVCTFNQTGNWVFYYIKSSDLEVRRNSPQCIEIFQRVPLRPSGPWKAEISEVL
jgi:hypothetical protein